MKRIKSILQAKYALLTDSNKMTYPVKDHIELKKRLMLSSGTPHFHPGISIATAVAVNSYFSLSSFLQLRCAPFQAFRYPRTLYNR